MKKVLLTLTVLIAISTLTMAQYVEKHGQLKVEGTQLTDQNGDAITLRGISFGWHNWWPRFYTEGSVKTLADDWKATVVRAAMGVDPDSGYIKKPEWSKERITTVIDAAIKEDIYVIIDWHSHHIRLDEAKEFFAEMSKKYGEYPHVIYEIYNEPVDDTWEEVKEYSIEVIKVIRENDPDNIILVGNPHWDQDVHLCADDPIEGFDNLMYTLHFYAGTHKEWLRERGDYAMEKGIALFVSESAGMEANGDGPLDLEEWERWVQWMEKNKISWVTWSISDKYETCSMLKESASSNGGWADGDLKESGLKTREYKRKYFDK